MRACAGFSLQHFQSAFCPLLYTPVTGLQSELVTFQLEHSSASLKCHRNVLKMGVGDIWGKGQHQESGYCSCNSSNEVPAAFCRAAPFPSPPSHKSLRRVVRCTVQPFQEQAGTSQAGHSTASKEHTLHSSSHCGFTGRNGKAACH